jgi:hypothetical protein
MPPWGGFNAAPQCSRETTDRQPVWAGRACERRWAFTLESGAYRKLRSPLPWPSGCGSWPLHFAMGNRDNREFNRESKNLGPSSGQALVQLNKELQSYCSQIPYAREQGIF